MSNMIELAKSIAIKAHAGQVDKAGVDYIQHPKKVASLVETENEKILAWLHDTVEDSDLTFEDIENYGFDNEIVEALKAITKKPGQNYEEYIENLKKNKLAVKVKIADLTHNSDISRIPNPSPKDEERVSKYLRLKEVLLDVLKNK